ncbi:hypothetical protein SASPL_117228 [Salvia splendens]|uniref:Uncharacterized protein n=1 Tax=Salvia splendens TaxID=180675 RepID=A0A8X8Y055_SALSN|nr:hypothetical protein SASPL_117228 [Salvia splendens]
MDLVTYMRMQGKFILGGTRSSTLGCGDLEMGIQLMALDAWIRRHSTAKCGCDISITSSHISGVPAGSPTAPYSSPSPSPTTLGDEESPSPAPTIVDTEYSPAPSPTGAGESLAPTPEYSLAPTPSVTSSRDSPAPAPFEDGEEEEELNNNNKYYYNNNNKEAYTYAKSGAQGMSDTRIEDNKYYYDNEHEHESQPEGMSDSRIQGSSEYYYNTKHDSYSRSGRESQPQGMSDTRIENNKYYNYSPVGGESSNEEGYYYNGSYNKSKYEFDSMEEYEKQQGYADVQQEFINP